MECCLGRIVCLFVVFVKPNSIDNLYSSGYEADVNKNNAVRQLAVNNVAQYVGSGTGTAHKDGVPGTPLGRTGYGNGYGYGHGIHGNQYGYAQNGYGYAGNAGYGYGNQAAYGHGYANRVYAGY